MPRRDQLKRACYEWGAIAAASASAGCLLLWVLYVTGMMKLAPHAADSPVLVGGLSGFPSGEGTVTLSRQIESLEQVDRWRRLQKLRSAVDRRWHAPGLIFQYLALPGAKPQWLLRCSLLVPTFLFAIMALALGWKYRRFQKRLIACPSSLASQLKSSGQETPLSN